MTFFVFPVLGSTELPLKLGEEDLNLRPLGYEPSELPDCSTPRHVVYAYVDTGLRFWFACLKKFFEARAP